MTKLLDQLLVTYSLSKCFAHIFQRDNLKKPFLTTLAHCTIKRFCFFLESRKFHGQHKRCLSEHFHLFKTTFGESC